MNNTIVGTGDEDDEEIEFIPLEISKRDCAFLKLRREVEESVFSSWGVPASQARNFKPSVEQ